MTKLLPLLLAFAREWPPDWDRCGAAQDVALAYRIGQALANG